MGAMKKNRIKWEWRDNDGEKWNGNYEGEIKNNKPHGVGKWKWEDGDDTVEGEWRDGLLHGRVVENWSDGYREEYEAREGKISGKLVRYYDDGRHD